jgi:uncharacterized protein YraI
MRIKLTIALFLVIVLLSSCNFPTPGGQIGPEVQTAAAQTVQAVLATPLSSATADPGILATATSSGSPILSVADNTNCRSGPGTNYAIITVLAGGSSAPVVGRHPGGAYWVVDPPSVAENCWVAAEFASVSGSTAGVPEQTPDPDEAASGVPDRPGSLFYNYVCSGGTVTTTLTWTDSADNENGYRVYRYDVLIADLPPNSTQYVDEVSGGGSTLFRFTVEAYNSAGPSASRGAEFSCQ